MSGAVETCPFCGGEASLTIPSELVIADCADIYVACDECEAEGQHIVVEMRDRGDDLWPDERREAITAWNTRATPPARSYADGDVETQWEVWEDDLMVASSTDEADARHYLAVYSQDGPVRLVKSVTVRTPCDPAPVLSQGGKA